MIKIKNVSIKHFSSPSKIVFKNISITIPSKNGIALIGQNGMGKSTLLRMISGIEKPNSGRIEKDGSVSWPVGLSSGLVTTMTGIENINFICEIYNIANKNEAIEYIKDHTGLHNSLKNKVSTYSSGMKAKLAFMLSLLIEFDTYLIDEISAVGDKNFRKKCEQTIERWINNGKRVIFVNHNESILKKHCQSAILIESKYKVTYYEDINEALDIYNRQQVITQ